MFCEGLAHVLISNVNKDFIERFLNWLIIKEPPTSTIHHLIILILVFFAIKPAASKTRTWPQWGAALLKNPFDYGSLNPFTEDRFPYIRKWMDKMDSNVFIISLSFLAFLVVSWWYGIPFMFQLLTSWTWNFFSNELKWNKDYWVTFLDFIISDNFMVFLVGLMFCHVNLKIFYNYFDWHFNEKAVGKNKLEVLVTMNEEQVARMEFKAKKEKESKGGKRSAKDRGVGGGGGDDGSTSLQSMNSETFI